MKWQTHTLWKSTRAVPGTKIWHWKQQQTMKQQRQRCWLQALVLCSCSSTWAAHNASSVNSGLLPWPSPEKRVRNVFENNQPEIHPPLVWYPYSPSSPVPFNPVWHLELWPLLLLQVLFNRHPLSTEQIPWGKSLGLQTISPMGKRADFECLLLWALGQETHGSRERDQQPGGKQSCLPKLHCTVTKCEMPVWEQRGPWTPLVAGCQRVPHNTQEETTALTSFCHGDNLLAVHTQLHPFCSLIFQLKIAEFPGQVTWFPFSLESIWGFFSWSYTHRIKVSTYE